MPKTVEFWREKFLLKKAENTDIPRDIDNDCGRKNHLYSPISGVRTPGNERYQIFARCLKCGSEIFISVDPEYAEQTGIPLIDQATDEQYHAWSETTNVIIEKKIEKKKKHKGIDW